MSSTDLRTEVAGRPTRAGDAAFVARLPAVLRPDPSLLKYYALSSLVVGPLFFFPLVPLYFKYRSLRYEVDEEGIAMRWGILFRREVSLTYARIQDIQLTSNFVERWLGLARIQVQTASGSATAEMTIEGVPAFDAMRDFLYARMRGAREDSAGARSAAARHPDVAGPGTLPGQPAPVLDADPAVLDELTGTLREIAAELRALRLEQAGRGSHARDG